MNGGTLVVVGVVGAVLVDMICDYGTEERNSRGLLLHSVRSRNKGCRYRECSAKTKRVSIRMQG